MLQENKEMNNTGKLTWEAPTVSAINTDETNGKIFQTIGEFDTFEGSQWVEIEFLGYLAENCISQQVQAAIAAHQLQLFNNLATSSLNPLSSVTGMQALGRHCYRPGLTLLMQKHQQLRKQNLQLAKQVKFYQLLLPNMENCGGVTGYRQWLNDFINNQISDCYFQHFVKYVFIR